MGSDRRQEEQRPSPETRQELAAWLRDAIPLHDQHYGFLLMAVDRILDRQEQLWQASKQDAIRAMSQGFTDKLARLKEQLAAKDATVSHIAEYFEKLVSGLNEKAGRDAKTNLLNFPRFEGALTILLATERRVRSCAVGLIDIAQFKWFNDTCGHMVGDQIIEQVAVLLRRHMRDRDLVAKDPDTDQDTLHARFGGDEFCFLLAGLADVGQVAAICRRFSNALSSHDWVALDPRLAERPVRVDIGVAWLELGPLAERRFLAPRLAKQLIACGDAAMYRAKADPQNQPQVVKLRVERGELVAADAPSAS